MTRLWGNVAIRLAAGYGLLAIGSMSVISAVFYIGTVSVLARSTDSKLQSVSGRLARHFNDRGSDYLTSEIQQLLSDGIEQDTEVYLLVAPDGRKLIGNIAGWSTSAAPLDQLTDLKVVRNGRASLSRLLPHRLDDGSVLVVGRDMQDRLEIEQLVWHALLAGGAGALVLAIGGALLFRRQLEQRVGAIRRAAAEVVAGDLSRRIPLSGSEDEFARLNRDINAMLDRIQHLMDGVRHVSNAIAHDLRTPLGRIRNGLDKALGGERGGGRLAEAAEFAIEQIDQLIRMLDRLLQIAEAEAGAGAQSFAPIAITAVIKDVVELYDAMAEADEIDLQMELKGDPTIDGDRNLLVNAVANLVDNAIKYAGSGATVRVIAAETRNTVSVIVEDNGPGIPEGERSRVIERFYRLDESRSLPGNGLGLSIVAAIAALHRGSLQLEDAGPGLSAHLVFPRAKHAQGASASPMRLKKLSAIDVPN